MIVQTEHTTSLNNFKNRLNDQSGQIAVVVFLMMAVLLVIGLSLAARTSQEIEQAGQAEDTTRVFNAAESGIEQALDEGVFTVGDYETIDVEDINNASVELKVTPTFDFAPIIQSGQSTTVYTIPNYEGDLVIRWGSGSTCPTNASIVVTKYVSTGGGNYKAEHEAYNPYGIDCSSRNNQFTNANLAGGTGNINGVSTPFQSRVDIHIDLGTAFIRIKPLYTSTQFHVSGDAIDSQSHIIRSQATDESTGNKEVRTIEVTRTRPAPPTILDYALYSGGTLEKN